MNVVYETNESQNRRYQVQKHGIWAGQWHSVQDGSYHFKWFAILDAKLRALDIGARYNEHTYRVIDTREEGED